jgi:hypothetical protein
MAQLDAGARAQVVLAALKALCARRVAIPVGHQAVEALVSTIDEQLEAAETATLQAVPQATRDWLVAHQEIAHELMAYVETKRKEVL